MNLDRVFENNEKWIKDKLAVDPKYFEAMGEGQNPELLFIGCSDSRVTAEELMGLGPIGASLKALKRAQLNINDIDIVELNEAFASQSIACIKELQINPEIVNIDGGAIALGHPLGATGTRITAKAAYLMNKLNKKYALATQCIGLGQGIATVLERVS